ncbi:LysR family transcriptional regulator [Nocardia salmonicida]|uniref:LysR family transcriptional regulator n=1 Tax=Nocardia salmonicida TaxID=53431 RepID=UPI003CF5E54B
MVLLLHPAMETVGGLARLRCFALAAQHSTLLAAANHCGIGQEKLAADIALLEGDLNNHLLIHHADSDGTIAVTDFGQEVRAAVARVLIEVSAPRL